MMRKVQQIASMIILTTLVNACACINSVEPFSDKQAASIIKQWYRSNGIYS